jgi:hypothetical protein
MSVGSFLSFDPPANSRKRVSANFDGGQFLPKGAAGGQSSPTKEIDIKPACIGFVVVCGQLL